MHARGGIVTSTSTGRAVRLSGGIVATMSFADGAGRLVTAADSSWHNENDHFTPWGARSRVDRDGHGDPPGRSHARSNIWPAVGRRVRAGRRSARPGASSRSGTPGSFASGGLADGSEDRARSGRSPLQSGAASVCRRRTGRTEGKTRGVHGNLSARSMHCVRMGGADLPVAVPMSRVRIRPRKRRAGPSGASTVAATNAAGASVGRRSDSCRTLLGAAGGSCEPHDVIVLHR
jgi:hypothetical protein